METDLTFSASPESSDVLTLDRLKEMERLLCLPPLYPSLDLEKVEFFPGKTIPMGIGFMDHYSLKFPPLSNPLLFMPTFDDGGAAPIITMVQRGQRIQQLQREICRLRRGPCYSGRRNDILLLKAFLRLHGAPDGGSSKDCRLMLS